MFGFGGRGGGIGGEDDSRLGLLHLWAPRFRGLGVCTGVGRVEEHFRKGRGGGVADRRSGVLL